MIKRATKILLMKEKKNPVLHCVACQINSFRKRLMMKVCCILYLKYPYGKETKATKATNVTKISECDHFQFNN